MIAQVRVLARTEWLVARLRRRLQAEGNSVEAAYQAQRRHLAVTERDVSDAGLPRDDVVGGPAYQADLPFFLQTGFGTRR